MLIYSGGAALGPLIVGPAMDLESASMLFVIIAVLLGSFAAYSLIRMMVRRVAEPPERTEFVALPRTTPTLYSLEESQEPYPEDEWEP